MEKRGRYLGEAGTDYKSKPEGGLADAEEGREALHGDPRENTTTAVWGKINTSMSWDAAHSDISLSLRESHLCLPLNWGKWTNDLHLG